jgi:hypothetical protein
MLRRCCWQAGGQQREHCHTRRGDRYACWVPDQTGRCCGTHLSNLGSNTGYGCCNL